MTEISQIHVGILRYPGAQEAAILGLVDLFIVANQLVKYENSQSMVDLKVSIIQLEDKIDYTNIAFLKTKASYKEFSALILPPCLKGIPDIDSNLPYIRFLKSHHEKGTILASVCAGAFLLAGTGLLSNRYATTHWSYNDQFQVRFPKIIVDTDQLLIDDGDIITAGGAMSWGDLGLRLIERFFGPIVKIAVAKMFVMQPSGREQCHYRIFSPCLEHGDSAILKAQNYISKSKGADLTLVVLSKVTQLEIRTMQRRFVKATGMNITEYIQRHRVHKAQEFLQFSDLCIEHIAKKVGYKDYNAFCKIFIKIVGITPNVYRNNFSIL
ncbi:GlxA family transcriptional regulator [Commensalibacter oyaizuii]|uniref:Helix-turn-helix domain-containing protein n=1 Tax=Commensalibacter oyaizuii TaxID=3043873 RepID=A0ABT6Q3X2_9PROT|nr:helix-turn-helix domain-containing protein [Commensalibacter sp. TBRC 16381]MDI2091668.1 helix-turn-helix domain-containing protein [Commensalibacter sp. TBRC 16381]